MNAIFKCLLFVLYFLHSICYNPLMSLFYALVAQLDRVTDSDVSEPIRREKPKAVDTTGLFGRESDFSLVP